MSDVYIPGVKSRFNSEKMIEDLMTLERIPRERVGRNIENLQVQKGYWQEVGRRITSVRDSARFLYSFQNPFNDRIAKTGNDNVITASATREAQERTYAFTVKQTAQADRFISQPLDEKMRVDAGNYSFNVGNEEISINFRGGTLKDFVDAFNHRSKDKISASLIAVQSGTKSLLIESKVTGAQNKLTFSGDSVDFTMKIGMMEKGGDNAQTFLIGETSVKKGAEINNSVIKLPPQSSASLPLHASIDSNSLLMLKIDTSTRIETDANFGIPKPPPGPSVPSASVSYGGITIENEPSLAPIPEWKTPAAPQRHDDMAVLSLVFSDGSSAKLPPITDSTNFTSRQYFLSEIAQGRTITSLNIENTNTHREISIGNIEISDPNTANNGLRPVNAVSTARDAIITMEGIEIKRPTNSINDLVPGLTLNVKGVSEKPVEIDVKADIEGIKEAIITFVGNYNRLIAEINVLTARSLSSVIRTTNDTVIKSNVDDTILNELTYLTSDERTEMRNRLGVFNGDVTLTNLKNNLMRTVSAPYPTSLERELSMLAQIGISSNATRVGGYDASKLRGYLEIDEKVLDAALENKVPAIKELFASDTTGDLIANTGIAYNVDTLVKPFVETGGIIFLKNNTLDSRISQDEKRIATLDRQLAVKEADLKAQYARMESAYSRMEQMSNSLDNFNQQNRINR
ncbi:MAG: flagellar filament capping protein FliD [Treponema sp.]|jgi:flagellar hook-associated protein 2|nr:flagellar filament capping protein FliD [Treponema sp.]